MDLFGNLYEVFYINLKYRYQSKCVYILYILEPSFLEKIAKQEVEEKNATPEVMETVIEEIVNNDGQKQLVTTIKPSVDVSSERIFQYDIMISYCHADKELTYKIHKFLVDQGLKVWIDLDSMYGPGKRFCVFYYN